MTAQKAPADARATPLDHGAGLLERLVFSRRLLVLLLFAALTVGFGWQASKLRPDASFEKMLPAQHPYIRAMLRHLDDLGASGTTVQIVIANTQGDIFDPAYLEVLRQVTDEAFYIDGVDRNRLKSLWTPNVRWTEVTAEGFEGGVIIPDNYTGRLKDLELLRRNILRSGQVGRLVADDFRSSIVEVAVFDRDPISGAPLDYRSFARELEEKIRSRFERDGISIHMVGFAKIVGDLIEGITAIFLFGLIALAITAALLYFHTRCLMATLAPILCSVMAVIWMLGALASFGYGLNAYSILVPFLVFAIGVSHGVQVVSAVGAEAVKDSNRLRAAQLAFRGLYIAGIAALVSDAVGFMTMQLIHIAVIQELGIAASLGVGAIILTNLVLLPVLMSCFGICAKGVARVAARQSRSSGLWLLVARCSEPRVARVSLILAATLFAVGLAGGQQLRVGDLDPGAPELRPDSRYNIDSRFITEHYGISSDVLVVMVETKPESCYLYANLEQIDNFSWQMRAVPGVESVISLVDVAKLVMMAFNEGSLKWAALSRNQRALDTTFGQVPEQLVNRNCSLAPVALFLQDHKAETLQSVVDAVENFAKTHNSPDLRFVLAAGNAGVEAATNQEVRKAQTRILVLVYMVVSALVLLSFRSLAATMCIVLPLTLTTVLCNALMAWLGIGLKVATLPVVVLGVGVGVDYAIYLYNRLRLFLSQGMPLQEAYLNALRSTGAAVCLTGLALAIGTATWMWSPIKFQADMGKLLTFMFVWNMLGALWLLPALAHYLVAPSQRPAATTTVGNGR